MGTQHGRGPEVRGRGEGRGKREPDARGGLDCSVMEPLGGFAQGTGVAWVAVVG